MVVIACFEIPDVLAKSLAETIIVFPSCVYVKSVICKTILNASFKGTLTRSKLT